MKTLIGIDWSAKHHDVRLHNEAGALLSRFRILHNLAGFQKLANEIAQVNPKPRNCLIGIETADNMLVDFLWSHQYRLYVCPLRHAVSDLARHTVPSPLEGEG